MAFINGILRKHSKNSNLGMNLGSMYSAGMSSYIRACERDPDLKTLDLRFYRRTNKALSLVLVGAEDKNLSIDAFAEIYEAVLEVNECALTVITENKKHVEKNKQLKALVEVYYKTNSMTFSFSKMMNNCINRVEESQRILQLAVNQFEEESVGTGNENKYFRTVQELKKFKPMGDVFDGNFLGQYASVYAQQVVLLKELSEHNVKLDAKVKNSEEWKKVMHTIFISARIAILVLSVALAAVVDQDYVSALASAMAQPIEWGGHWCNKLWTAYVKALEKEKSFTLSMEIQTFINNKGLTHLVHQAEEWRCTIASIRGLVQLAIENEKDDHVMTQTMQQIKRQFGTFKWRIKPSTELISFKGRYNLVNP